jgi:hypothetical protein
VVQTAPPPAAIVAADPPAQVVALNRLPDTASYLPLIALCGFLALGAAFVLRSIRRNV